MEHGAYGGMGSYFSVHVHTTNVDGHLNRDPSCTRDGRLQVRAVVSSLQQTEDSIKHQAAQLQLIAGLARIEPGNLSTETGDGRRAARVTRGIASPPLC